MSTYEKYTEQKKKEFFDRFDLHKYANPKEKNENLFTQIE